MRTERVTALGVFAQGGLLICAFVFLWAGYGKLIAPEQVYRPLASLGVPADYVHAAALAMGIAEVALGIGPLLLMPRTKGCAIVFAIALIAFSGVLAFLYFFTTVPSCGCLIASFGKSRGSSFVESFIRNGVLFALLIPALLTLRQPPVQIREEASRLGAWGARRGVTLVELLVVIGIIALLLSLLLPALARSRRAAQMTACRATLRELGAAMQMYANDNEQTVPRDHSMPPVGSNRPMWMLLIGPYLEQRDDWDENGIRLLREKSAFNCPSHPLLNEIPGSFVVNAFAFETAPHWRPLGPSKITHVTNASDVIWVAEAADLFPEVDSTGQSKIFRPEFHDVWMPLNLPGGGFQRISDDRHGGSANLLFFDASVRTTQSGKLKLSMFDDGFRGKRDTEVTTSMSP